MLKGLYLLNEGQFENIYNEKTRYEIEKHVDFYAPLKTKETLKNNMSILNEAQVIFSGWGCPKMDKAFLDSAPELKVVFYGAGSIKGFVTDEFWNRDILITSAYGANGIPVADYTLSQILFSLKRGWYFSRSIRRNGKYPARNELNSLPGGYGSTIGIVSLGMVGRYVCERLKNYDLEVIAYDPYVSQKEATNLQVNLCSLEDVFKYSDVVSLHTPWLEETVGMINGELISSMKTNATLINTARGALIKENELIDVLQARTDLFTILDVTYPEPPEEGSPLYSLYNVVLTPHIAGPKADECNRMGEFMLAELKRYLNQEPLKWGISKERSKIMA